jgi:D-serine deaminase-like pyridoxal phosphate-dependent protein
MLSITRPTLLLNENQCKANIKKMVDKANRLNVDLIPHFKTHQSFEIGEWFREQGVDRITVSSVKMAEFFAKVGWENITIAFPINVLEIPVINQLLERSINLTLFVVNTEAVDRLNQELIAPVNIFIELDAGYPRSGIPTYELNQIQALAQAIINGEKTSLYGLYCHPGNTYQSSSVEEIKQIWVTAIAEVNKVKAHLNKINDNLKVRIGDTPGCSVVEDFMDVDEIGPGNFVFFDLVMNYLNVCAEEEIAVAVACPVVAKYPERNEIIIHGGAVHFSKDHLFDNEEVKFFGEVVIFEKEGWSPIIDGIKLTSLSQEHGKLTASPELLETIEVGDVIGVLPIHSCLTANLMKSYMTFDGQNINHLEKL